MCCPKPAILDVYFCFKFLPGAKRGENAAIGKLDTFEFTFNSTNMTQFTYGIAANVVSVLLYGSNFVPVKRIDTGDGEHTTQH